MVQVYAKTATLRNAGCRHRARSNIRLSHSRHALNIGCGARRSGGGRIVAQSS
jgi:hypothetical protein